MRRFKKALIERALGAELRHHLGYPPGGDETRRDHQPSQRDAAARRVLTDDGPVPLEVPRDREGTLRAAADWQA